VRSEAVLESLRQFGGLWSVVAAALGLVPRPLADRLYDGVARVRGRLLRRPATRCPVVPAGLRARFLP
jgi:predicted DCC family thiol-disulfide oxidoreductase YuxK